MTLILRIALAATLSLLSGCLLSDGSELIPTGSPAKVNPGISVSQGLTPTYSWAADFGPVASLTVTNISFANQPAWGIATAIEGKPLDSIPSPVIHGQVPEDPATKAPLAAAIGSSNETTLQPGVQYRVAIFRASDGRQLQVNFVPPYGTEVAPAALTSNIEVASSPNSLHTLAVKAGQVLGWGALLPGSNVTSADANLTRAISITDLKAVKSVASGANHSLALKLDGTVWAWGANASGQLGNGYTSDSAVPTQVTGLSNIFAIAAGEAHSLALDGNGLVWSWGENSSGQLGDGGTSNRITPARVYIPASIVAISAGKVHSLAVTEDGSIWAWGGNYNGQLGNGTVSNSALPVLIDLD